MVYKFRQVLYRDYLVRGRSNKQMLEIKYWDRTKRFHELNVAGDFNNWSQCSMTYDPVELIWSYRLTKEDEDSCDKFDKDGDKTIHFKFIDQDGNWFTLDEFDTDLDEHNNVNNVQKLIMVEEQGADVKMDSKQVDQMEVENNEGAKYESIDKSNYDSGVEDSNLPLTPQSDHNDSIFIEEQIRTKEEIPIDNIVLKTSKDKDFEETPQYTIVEEPPDEKIDEEEPKSHVAENPEVSIVEEPESHVVEESKDTTVEEIPDCNMTSNKLDTTIDSHVESSPEITSVEPFDHNNIRETVDIDEIEDATHDANSLIESATDNVNSLSEHTTGKVNSVVGNEESVVDELFVNETDLNESENSAIFTKTDNIDDGYKDDIEDDVEEENIQTQSEEQQDSQLSTEEEDEGRDDVYYSPRVVPVKSIDNDDQIAYENLRQQNNNTKDKNENATNITSKKKVPIHENVVQNWFKTVCQFFIWFWNCMKR